MPPATFSRLIAYQVTDVVTFTRALAYSNAAGCKPAPAAAADGFAPEAAVGKPLLPPAAAFRRVVVDNLVTGGTRVTWELTPAFLDRLDRVGDTRYQLQWSPSGVPNSDDWRDVGPAAADPAFLVDPDQRTWVLDEVKHYRVRLTCAAGVLDSDPTLPVTRLSPRHWQIAREVARKEELRNALLAGVPGHLLKARRQGVRCACVNPTTRERGNSSCATCYGTGFVGGYHPPLPGQFAALPPYEAKLMLDHEGGTGTVQPTTLLGRTLASLPVRYEDAWVADDSDDRYYVHKVQTLVNYRGVPVVLGAELRLAPRSDVLYKFPVQTAPGAAAAPLWGAAAADQAPETVTPPAVQV